MTRSTWNDQVRSMRERLSEPLLWFPFPALIAFGLVIVLRGHLFNGLNHRLGTKANVVELKAEELKSPGIWMSITEEDNSILIVCDDHQRFTFPLATRDVGGLKAFTQYLDERAREIAFKSSLDLEVDRNRIRAVLAVDQKLRYFHIRPVLYALAEAGISQYGFETKLVTASTGEAKAGTHHEEHL